MRRLRWKSKFATGNRRLDDHNKALVGVLLEIDAALRAKEHCQDMEDLYATLTDVSGERLAQGASFARCRASDTAIRELLNDNLPLAALNTPACRDCDICELTGERLSEWLDRGAELGPSSVVHDQARELTADAAH